MSGSGLWILAQVADDVDLAEGVGYGTGLSTWIALVGGLMVVAVLIGVVFAGIRYVRAAMAKSSSAPGRMLPPETRRRVDEAIAAGDFDVAGDLLTRAEALEEAAEAYLKGGVFVKAARSFEQAGSRPQAIYCYKRAGDHEQAARIYEQMDEPRAAAAEYFQAGAWERAAIFYERAKDMRRAAENYARARRWLESARAFDAAGMPREAAEHYARHVEHYRADHGGYEGGALPEELREQARRAGELFREAGEIQRASEIFLAAGLAQEAAETLRVSGDFSRAAELLIEARQPQLAAKFLEEAGEAKRAARMRAQVALADGDRGGAAEHLRDAGELEQAAELFAEVGKTEQAAELYEKLEAFEEALELYLKIPRYAHAARCAEQAGLLARAAEYYQEAGDVEGQLRVLELQGDFFRVGRLRFEHRMYEEALEALSKLDSRDAMYARSLELQGDVLRAQGRAEKAYGKYRAALGNREAELATLPLLYKMGRALEDEPDLPGALECYSKVLEVEANFEDASMRVGAIRKRLRRGTLTGRTSSGLFGGGATEDGEVARRYEILEEIARGGMGIVYKARDTVLGRVVAFKILGENLRDNETAVMYFLREARAAAALSHPNIVTIYDAGEQDGEYYMAMEFVEGTTLKELVRRTGALADDKVRHILLGCARALQYAHGKGIIHRDIKSGNVMTTRDRSLKVMDFGLAKFLKEYQNNHTQQVGTPFYMSPEQIIGRDIDFRSDLYSLGCMIFECATGTVPFFKGDLSYHHLHTRPPSPRSINPGLSEETDRMILKLLEKEPDARYQSAKEIIDELSGSVVMQA
ncbi:serine/threonine-protein kinase [Lujinxingia litoralis]|nr:serine/threonine-protein kinase [Lujinxingia litoralis]